MSQGRCFSWLEREGRVVGGWEGGAASYQRGGEGNRSGKGDEVEGWRERERESVK